MAKRYCIFLGIVLILFSACATHKPSAEAAPEAKNFDLALSQGDFYLKQSDYPKAIEEFKKAIILRPDSARAYNLLGMAYFLQKNYNLAEENFEKAISLDTSYAQAYNNLGNTYFVKRQFDKAKELFKKALSLVPDLISANYSLGTLLVYEGNFEEGTVYLSRGIELDPEYLEKHKTFVASISSPVFGSSEIYFTYAKLFATAGNVEKTLEYLKKAKEAGFRDWERVMEEKEFDKVRDDPRIKEFLSLFPS